MYGDATLASSLMKIRPTVRHKILVNLEANALNSFVRGFPPFRRNGILFQV